MRHQTETEQPSGLEATIDEVMLRLAEMRSARIVRQKARIDEDDPDDLRALAALTADFARAVDPLFHRLAYEGGLTSQSGASEYANVVTDAVSGNLDYELTSAAEKIDDDRAAERRPFDTQRALGTLNKQMQGV